MAATETGVETYRNFIGGEWVDPAEGRTEEVINPATGEAIAARAAVDAADVDRAVARRPRRRSTAGRHHARRALARAAASSPTRSRSTRDELAALEARQRRQAA